MSIRNDKQTHLAKIDADSQLQEYNNEQPTVTKAKNANDNSAS